jgi:hypothetical protein
MWNDSNAGIRRQIQAKISLAEQREGDVDRSRSDSEIRLFQLDCEIREGQRELRAMDALERGEENWPNERGPRT